jgi:hypothetical protein
MADQEYWVIHETYDNNPDEPFDYLDLTKLCKPYKVKRSSRYRGENNIYIIQGSDYYGDKQIQIYYNEIFKDQLSAEKAYVEKLKERILQDQEEIRLAEERISQP